MLGGGEFLRGPKGKWSMLTAALPADKAKFAVGAVLLGKKEQTAGNQVWWMSALHCYGRTSSCRGRRGQCRSVGVNVSHGGFGNSRDRNGPWN